MMNSELRLSNKGNKNDWHRIPKSSRSSIEGATCMYDRKNFALRNVKSLQDLLIHKKECCRLFVLLNYILSLIHKCIITTHQDLQSVRMTT